MHPDIPAPSPSSANSASDTGSSASGGIPLARLARGQRAVVLEVRGPRVFRRRLLELGLIPGVEVEVVNVAPLGDPLELEVRHCRLSIRRREAAVILVAPNKVHHALKVLP